MARTRLELHNMLCDLEQEVSAIVPHVAHAEMMEFFADQAQVIEGDTSTAEDLSHVRMRLRRILVGQGLLEA